MTNSEYLKKVKKEDDEFDAGNRNRGMSEIEFRKGKALEIIAEQMINLENAFADAVIALENFSITVRQIQKEDK